MRQQRHKEPENCRPVLSVGRVMDQIIMSDIKQCIHGKPQSACVYEGQVQLDCLL